MNIEIYCNHSGCSCGCTQPENITFKGEEPDIYVAIAEWAQDFLTTTTDPFSKLTIPQQSKDILLKIIPLSKERKFLDDQKTNLQLHIKRLKEAAKKLEIEMPENKKSEIKNAIKTISKIDKAINTNSIKKTTIMSYDEYKVKQDECKL